MSKPALSFTPASRELQRELRLGRIPSVAVVTRAAIDDIRFEQDGDLGVGAGARFGLVAGALAGALLLAPLAGLLAVGASLDGVGGAITERELRLGIALVAAFTSGLTALASALGGAVLGGLAALLLNFGIPNRELHAVGEELNVGQAALVARVDTCYHPIIVDLLALEGGTLMRPAAGAAAPAAPEARDAARFAAEAYEHAGGAPARRYEPVALAAAPVDPRQRDLIVVELDSAEHARRAARELARLRRGADRLSAGNLAQAHPDRSKGYLLVDTAAQAPTVPRWLAARTPWLIGLAGRTLELLPSERRRLLHADMPSFKGTRDIEPARLVSDAEHTTLRAWLLVYRGIAQYDGVASLRSMTQPVWVIVGEEDTVFTVEDSQAIQRHVPGSRLITVPGANHIIVVRDNAIFERGGPGSGPNGSAAVDARRTTVA